MTSNYSRRSGQKLGFIPSLLLLSPILIGVPLYSYKHHIYLPEPLHEQYDPVTNLSQISESRILEVSRILSEDIGFRTPGTREHALGEDWLWDQVTKMKDDCDELVKKTPHRHLECEIWRQKGSGSHRFDMMGARLYKTYVNLGNIVVRLSNGTDASKEHSVLVNAHLDSTLPTPGAADDAICVGIMMEAIRVLVESKDWEPKHAVVFLFNNAEESLQDGSHLFSTQHEVATTVRAVINLEAAGTTGRELLFQATSKEMIEAYSHVPRPFGTVIANDVFSSGIILSDTDFRQFQQYLGVTGLDMAIVGNSYLYHMRKDVVENIQPGVAQNFAENTLALLFYLSSPPPTSPSIASLTAGYTKPSTVYFALFGKFWMYSFSTAKLMYVALLVDAVVLVTATSKSRRLGTLGALCKPTLAVLFAFVGSVLGSNVVALVMKYVLGKPLSWFRNEYSPMVLYGPAAALGALVSQYPFTTITELQAYHATLLVQSCLALAIQLLGIGSAALFFLNAASLWVGLAVTAILGLVSVRTGRVSLLTYALAASLPLFLGSSSAYLTLEVFVPLTGRIGADAPADNLIASIISIVGALGFPLFVPFVWRFQTSNKRILNRLIVVMALVTAIPIAVFSVREPFDTMHQKRVYVMRTENITTGEHHLHLSTSDGAPSFEHLVYEVAKEFSAPPMVAPSAANRSSGDIASVAGDIPIPEPILMDWYNSDWDPMFPFSLFLTPYKIPLPVHTDYISPWSSKSNQEGGTGFAISAVDDIVDLEAGTRSLKLVIWHPGLIWTVIAFDAHVLKWNLDDEPPNEYTRHHIKEASYYGSDTWSVDLLIQIPTVSDTKDSNSGAGEILVNFIGLEEEGMWPGKKALLEGKNAKQPGLALKLFSTLDAWIEKETGGKVDALLLGCVAGAQHV
ncbi:hypothetical protein J3R30DRAFT_3296811 [Lentinula aciculospora]|uniref:Peptide hydrolase n=1 Tax=Lentinula aciculospora TaxID=153920 RepID=A0A9W9A5A1_9AGAR|nr:hypothetical protein J3R30DRAFT_3296811 [Lentinula aciculospora]